MEKTGIAIVGAGAAGLTASKTLEELGIAHIVLEAKTEPGGRTYCDRETFNFPYDLGGFWISDDGDNALVQAAHDLGFDISDETFPWPDMPMILGDRWETQSERDERLAYNAQWLDAIDRVDVQGEDCTVASLAPPEARWKDILATWMGMLQNRPVDQISAVDQASARHGTYRQVREGMGELVRRWTAGRPVRLETPVERITYDANGVVLHTPGGQISADAAIVTASTGVLSSGLIRFEPDLPEATRAALERLPMGNVNRIAIKFDTEVFGPETPPCFGRFVSRDDYVYVMTRLVGEPVALGYVGDDLADRLEAEPDERSVNLVLDALRLALGKDLSDQVQAVHCTRWRADPWTLGAYAAPGPGDANARAVLRVPLGGRVFLAGEASSADQFAHVHGAANEGARAARAAAQVVSR